MYVQCKTGKDTSRHFIKTLMRARFIIYNNKYRELELITGDIKYRIWLKYEKSGKLGNISLILIVSYTTTSVYRIIASQIAKTGWTVLKHIAI